MTEPYVELLDEPAITLASGRQSFRPDKRYYFLAYLARHRDWVPRERLARLFWPEHSRSKARLNLRQLVKRTRRLPWQAELETSGDANDLQLRWRPRTDLAALELALAHRDWESALLLYRGPLLGGLRVDGAEEFAVWLDFERLQLQERWRAGVLSYAAELGSNGDHHRAAHVLMLVLRQDEFDEEVLREFMTSSVMCGHATRALAAYDAFEGLLESEMGLIPSSTTQELAQHIRSGDAAIVVARTQVPSQPTNADTVSSRSSTVTHSTTPVTPPPLIGRELEMSDLAHQLRHRDCRLLTVTGPGGVGKTLLTRHAIAELRQNYQDGAIFVPLEALRESSSVPGHIASALGLAMTGVDELDPLERVVLAIGDKQILLVLDNIDHLEGAGEVVSRLVAGCPRLDLITTSRERLDLVEEWLLPIDGFPSPAVGIDLATATSYDAVQLFVRRAERLRPSFYLAEQDLPYVITICRLVDGLPLGIELAAAWLRLLSCREIAKEIEHDTDFLDRSPSNAAERHRSIRATFEHSWRRLGFAEQSVLRDLSVFRGEFHREAGTYVADTKLPVLAALVDKSLLITRAEGRFCLHPLLRQYAYEKLAADPVALRRKREAHSRYYLNLLTRSSEFNGGGLMSARAALDEAFDELAAAWHWACGSRPLNELGRAAAPLAGLCVHRGRYYDGILLLTTALDSSTPEPLGSLAYCRLLLQRARLEERLGRFEEAQREANRGLDLLPLTGAQRERLSGLQVLGKVAVRSGRYAEAKEIFLEALAIAEEHRSLRDSAQLMSKVGLAEQYLGRRARAAVWYRRALRLQSQLENLPGVVSARSNLGNVLRLLDQPAAAREMLDQALALAESIAAADILPNLHINLGVLDLDQSHPSQAAKQFGAALQLARRSGNRSLEANANFQLGRLALAAGQALASQSAFLDSLLLATEIGQREKMIDNLVGLAWARWRCGDLASAKRWLSVAADHSATSPGTSKWAGELRQALAEGVDPTLPAVGSMNVDLVVARAVERAIARLTRGDRRIRTTGTPVHP